MITRKDTQTSITSPFNQYQGGDEYTAPTLVPLERLAALLCTPHAHLIALKDSFVGYVIPSKIYACLESKKSVIFVGSAESDVELLARRSSAGYWRVSCGDAAGFAAALEQLADRIGKPQPLATA